jgi:hypothetical protein
LAVRIQQQFRVEHTGNVADAGNSDKMPAT